MTTPLPTSGTPQSDSHEIIVDEQAHFPACRPSPKSPSVQRARSQLLTYFDLPSLVTAFYSLTNSLSSAYRGLAHFPVLQSDLSCVSIAITRLAHRTASTVEEFTTEADSVLDQCEVIYELLAKGMEAVACEVLKEAGNAGGNLAKKAGDLSGEFEEAAKSVSQTLRDAQKQQASQMEKRKQLELQREDVNIHLRRAQMNHDSVEEARVECDRLVEQAEKKEWWANFKCNALQVAQILSLAGSLLHSRMHLFTFSSVTAFAGTLENERMNAREEKAIHLYRKQKYRVQNLDLRKEIAELSSRLDATESEECICQTTITALENTIATLRALSANMMKVESFWSQLHSSCGRLDATGLLSYVESSTKLEKRDRAALWASRGFKRRAVSFYAQWAALHSICVEYGRLIREAHQGFYHVIEGTAQSDTRRELQKLAL